MHLRNQLESSWVCNKFPRLETLMYAKVKITSYEKSLMHKNTQCTKLILISWTLWSKPLQPEKCLRLMTRSSLLKTSKSRIINLLINTRETMQELMARSSHSPNWGSLHRLLEVESWSQRLYNTQARGVGCSTSKRLIWVLIPTTISGGTSWSYSKTSTQKTMATLQTKNWKTALD